MAKLYRLNSDKVAESKFGAQASLIIKALEDHQPDTVAGVAARIKDELQTRQTPERVVNFYLSSWQKKGITSVVGEQAAETPVSTGTSNDDSPTGDIADVAAPALDLSSCSMKEAVLHVVDQHANSTAADIHHHLQIAGRTVTIKQIADAINRSIKAGHLQKNEEGRLSIPE